jgi:hypothetical protein
VEPLVIHRVKKLALICVYAVHQKRWVQILIANISNILIYLFLLITWFKNTCIHPKWTEYPMKFYFFVLLSFSWNRMNFYNGTHESGLMISAQDQLVPSELLWMEHAVTISLGDGLHLNLI